jgi:hypothetical protein
MQNKFRFEKRLSGYVRKWFICYSPASSGGKRLNVQKMFYVYKKYQIQK